MKNIESIEVGNSRPKVLICGAGPTGLVLATYLVKAGIDVSIIDKRRGVDRRSKALAISPASLEVFDDLGIVDPFLKKGLKNYQIGIWWRNRRLNDVAFFEVASRFPFFLMLPQYQTERILRRNLSSLGCEILTETELVNLRQNVDYVEVTTRQKNGVFKQSNFNFVIGCDGSHSSVREFASLGWSGHDYKMRFVLCDAFIDPGRFTRHMHYVSTPNSFAGIFPVDDQIHRVVIKTDSVLSESSLNSNLFNTLSRQHGLGINVDEIVWSSQSQFFSRIADHFYARRVALAGDAAHLFSPVGGQGMNSGIWDAYNLAAALKLVFSGMPLSILARDGHLRREHAKAIGILTDRLTKAISNPGKGRRGIMKYFLPRRQNDSFLLETLPSTLAGIRIDSSNRSAA